MFIFSLYGLNFKVMFEAAVFGAGALYYTDTCSYYLDQPIYVSEHKTRRLFV